MSQVMPWPVKISNRVSSVLPAVWIVTVLVAGAVHSHHTDGPGLPECNDGSPNSCGFEGKERVGSCRYRGSRS